MKKTENCLDVYDKLLPRYKMGKRKNFKPLNKNGKIAFTTTLYPEIYEWLKQQSILTQKSASEILNKALEDLKASEECVKDDK